MPRAGERLHAQVPPDELDVWQCCINNSIKNSHHNEQPQKKHRQHKYTKPMRPRGCSFVEHRKGTIN